MGGISCVVVVVVTRPRVPHAESNQYIVAVQQGSCPCTCMITFRCISLYLVALSRSARMSMYSRCHLQQFRHELHRATCSHWRPLWPHHLCDKHPRWICSAAVNQEGLVVRFRPATDKDMPTAKQLVLQERYVDMTMLEYVLDLT